ncbi:putative phospholipid-binding lipoprotein MlaA precursor [Roseovarius gaetbuli]|uniref:Putative phospholipid-binding lipoprotein MlaA n=1 Tax=Roseovarius gaetbuli TaxID=1356575 RepID=A0A1X6ZI61_9RHOB|nr:VacJ family lipoprotein [Roseovarius gaetbuli]SLN52247.1 putative phospholipid-binding lipoprotein MlaA precursor [Roseovarius gaetbuli]
MLPLPIEHLSRPACRVAALIGLVLLAACAKPDPSRTTQEAFDPYESQNREVHQFNRGVDRALLRPVSKGYTSVVPDDIENAIVRFAVNLSLPSDIVNNVLQLNMRGALRDTARLLVNTTVGLGGFFDPASEMGMAAGTNTDFGQTLHVWGAREGAYVELPILGPSTERDTWGMAVDLFTNPLSYVLESPENLYGTAAAVSAGLSKREKYGDTIDSILYESADSYAQSRSLYLQNRRFELGGTSSSAYVDPYDVPATSRSMEDPYDQ